MQDIEDVQKENEFLKKQIEWSTSSHLKMVRALNQLITGSPTLPEIETLQKKNDELKKQIELLISEIKKMKQDIADTDKLEEQMRTSRRNILNTIEKLVLDLRLKSAI